MAKTRKSWGIDIGQVALKALRCHLGADGQTIVADAYDYIEYPKILSQPEADAEELVREALEQFLSRNDVKGDFVAISVPGQAGLSRFFKPPPVNEKTLPDIVKFEVKQQIPFPIEDVIWDWQAMGGTVVNNMTTDAEVGLFAMKRDAVFRALKPFTDAKIDVDLVQMAPLATYNVICHDVLESIPTQEEINLDHPPESIVVVSLGTDTTDLIVTNGMKLWMRNIPIGGNHFTKQLSRDLKLTLAKAEHLKRNARKAEDPKTVFQAMRPVFTDLVTEVQRSLSFFQSMEKSARIEKLVLLGSAAQLPGLRQFMNSQLQLDIAKVEGFRHLTGPGVTDQPSFSNNVLSLAPCYGLCLQGLKKAQMNTNLLPEEFVLARMVEGKKPWILSAVAAVMLGCVIMLVMNAAAKYRVAPDNKQGQVSWKEARAEVQPISLKSAGLKTEDDELNQRLRQVNAINAELSSASETQSDWMELISAIYQSLPADERIKGDTTDLAFSDRKEIYIDYIDTKYFDDLLPWYVSIQAIYDYQFEMVGISDVQARASVYAARQKNMKVPVAAPTAPAASPTTGVPKMATINEVLTGPGWVIEISGYHFHNSDDALENKSSAEAFVVKSFLKNMITRTIKFDSNEFELSDVGVFYPTLVKFSETAPIRIPLPDATAESSEENARSSEPSSQNEPAPNNNAPPSGQAANPSQRSTTSKPTPAKKTENAEKCDFTIQLAWIPRSKQERELARENRLKLENATTSPTVAKPNSPATPVNSAVPANSTINGGNSTGDKANPTASPATSTAPAVPSK